MNWETFFEESESVTAEETRRFIESGEPERYQLVDVRQPKEYEHAHIPGAILLPLAELAKRTGELNRDKPTIVYCRSGVRSKAACQVLARSGIRHVFNMTGGIITWQGTQAEGDVEEGLEFFANGDFPTTFELAYQMEDGLRRFYLALAEKAELAEEKEMLRHLAGFEEGHMSRLKARYAQEGGTEPLRVMEGGLDIEQALEVFKNQLGSIEHVLQLGMKLEAQAFDLYQRLAWKHQEEETAAFFRNMAEDEQQHLLQLSGELDRVLDETRPA